MGDNVLIDKNDWTKIQAKVRKLKDQFYRYQHAVKYGLKMIDETIDQLQELYEDLFQSEVNGWFKCWDCKHPNAGQ